MVLKVAPQQLRPTKTNEKGIASMKLTTTTFVSVDGVMQGIGAPAKTLARLARIDPELLSPIRHRSAQAKQI